MKDGRLRKTAEVLIMDSTSKGPMNFGASFLEVDFRGMSLAAKPAYQVCTVARNLVSNRQMVVAFRHAGQGPYESESKSVE